MRKIALLGSTGSIGRQVLDVVARLPDRLKVVSLAAQRRVDLLANQVKQFRPALVSIGSEGDAKRLRERLRDVRDVQVGCGPDGLERAATLPEANVVVVSVAGAVGLAPTLAAISAGKHIALASKEVLVAAGSLVTKLVEERGVRLLPIDSEHSAVLQCLRGEDRKTVRKLILTASGGAFKDHSLEDLASVTVEQALAHPTWSMGPKITVDSATLMNKVLEIIEARWLFDIDARKIEVVIHPQSIVHSMVEFDDGSVIAQMGMPDMRLPIQYALLYPERIDTGLPKLDIIAQGSLDFREPDPARYPALRLPYEAIERSGTVPAVMNAANETAVGMFLDRKIGFLDIYRITRKVMDGHSSIPDPDLEQILEADAWAREQAVQITEARIV